MLSSFAEFYVEGGIWMHFILLAGLSGLATVTVQFLTLRAKWNGFRLTLGVFAGLLVLGMLGTVTGMIEAFAAIAAAPPDMRDQLTTQALGMALDTTAFALMFLAILIPPASIAVTLRSGVEPSVDVRLVAGLSE